MASADGRVDEQRLDLVLLGPAGAGKGTQARLLAARYGIPHVASGDLLRNHRQQGTPLGKKAEDYMQRGALVPDGLVVDMIVRRLREPDARRGVLLDGFPRTLPQAEALDVELAREGRSLKRAVYLKVPTEELIARTSGRLTCRNCQATYHMSSNPPRVQGVCDVCGGELYQRPDDQPDVVGERIRVYLDETLPVVAYYRERGILREIDGTRTIDEVAEAMAGVVQAP